MSFIGLCFIKWISLSVIFKNNLGLDGRDGIPGEPGLDGVPGKNGLDGVYLYLVLRDYTKTIKITRDIKYSSFKK